MKRGNSMKFSTKRIIAIVLAAVLVFSISVAVGSFSAAEDKSQPVAASAPEAKAAANAAADSGEVIPVTVVGNVKNIVKTSFETDQITLTWDKVSNASGYYVYCLNADGGKYTRVADVTSTKVTVKKLKHTTQYWFKVAAYLKVNGQKLEGQATVKKTATQPAKVTGLYSSRASTVNEMKWNRNDRATGYKIYRACYKTDGSYTLYKTITNNKTTTFTDTSTEQGRAYYYKVVAYRNLYNGAYSSAGNIVRFVVGMCAPDFSITSRLYRANINWNHNRYATGYDIFYSTNRSTGFKKLDTTKSNYFNTIRMSNNKTYYFRVVPYKYVGSSNTKVYGTYITKSCKITSGAYGKSVGSTYVEISIRSQHMWLYKNGKLIVETDVVTGNNDGAHNTPKGYHNIYSRARNTTLSGPGYSSFVEYWMAFCGGCGIHDASWRSEYGGNIYNGNGSHGCVNTPRSAVAKIWSNTGWDTPVIIY